MSEPIGWGKCFVIVKDLDDPSAKWKLLPTPKEDTCVLTPSEGNKKEATVEGGGTEDVKYGKNTYQLEYAIRRNKKRKKPFDDVDGVIAHRYAVFVQPENKAVPGPKIDMSVVTLLDGFDTTDGGLLTYRHDALTPDTGNMVKWCTIDQDLSKLQEGAELSTEPQFTDIDAPEEDG